MLIIRRKLDEYEIFSELSGNLSGFNDFDWYPWMNQSLNGSDLFVTSTKDLPIQLWSSGGGRAVCSWIAKDHLDQVANCLSVSFSPDGQKLISGGNNKLWIFDTNRPGDNSIGNIKTRPNKKNRNGQNGIISCLNFRYDNTGVFAAGSFSGTIGIYDGRKLSSSAFCIFDAHKHGVSQVKFLNDGWSILTSGRRDKNIKKFDLRMIQSTSVRHDPVLEYKLEEHRRTNQRIYFDTSFDGNLYTGFQNNLLEFQIASGELLGKTAFSDIVSSVTLNINEMVAISSGSRKFELPHLNILNDLETENICLKNDFGGSIELMINKNIKL